MFEIRKAEKSDLAALRPVYEHARAFMKKSGNPTQWKDSYPPESALEEHIEKGELYVAERCGMICGAFACVLDREPAYGGMIPEDGRFAVIHKLASDGTAGGIFAAAVGFAKTLRPAVMADTHRDNAPMLHLFEKHGFIRLGETIIDDGTERTVFILR